MFLISWNVAGWSSTSAAIRTCYGSLHEFFTLTQADIICIQECKGIRTRLNAQPVEMGASDGPETVRSGTISGANSSNKLTSNKQYAKRTKPSHAGIEGWESFWSLSTPAHRGFNGVVTFVKKGLTWSCDARPFDEDELNDEGRLVVTEHSHFVLFNVYVPNARGGKRFAFKMHFLRSLECVMTKWRVRTSKPIILVGDLNTTYRVEDAFWALRRINLQTLVMLNERAETLSEDEWSSATPHLSKTTLHRLTNMITNFLCDYVRETVREIEEKNNNHVSISSGPTTNSGSNTIKTHFALQSRANDEHSSEMGMSGSPTISVDGARFDDLEIIPSNLLALYDKIIISSHSCGNRNELTSVKAYGLDFTEPPISLRELYDAGMNSTFTDDFYRRVLPSHNRELYSLVQYCGLPPHADSTVRFLSRLLHVPAQVAYSSIKTQHYQHQHHEEEEEELQKAEENYEEQEEKEVLESDNTLESNVNQSTSEKQQKKATKANVPVQMWDTHVLTEDVIKLCNEYMTQNNKSIGNATMVKAMLDLQAKETKHNLSICPCPYTCWDQSRNKRQTNEGTRIDYILIDTELVPYVQSMRATENNTGLREVESNVNGVNNNIHKVVGTCNTMQVNQNTRETFFSELDGAWHNQGIHRATVHGAAPPAPFDGSGMPPVISSAKNLCFRGLPSTGLFVTMPQFSDHIGVCLLLDSERCTLLPRPGAVHECNECMYRPPVTLLSFFSKAKANDTINSNSSNSKNANNYQSNATDVDLVSKEGDEEQRQIGNNNNLNERKRYRDNVID